MKKRKPNPNKGKTWDEILGKEKADIRREQNRNALKGKPSPLKGMTYEEIGGSEEKGKQMREARCGEKNGIHKLSEEARKNKNKKISDKQKISTIWKNSEFQSKMGKRAKGSKKRITEKVLEYRRKRKLKTLELIKERTEERNCLFCGEVFKCRKDCGQRYDCVSCSFKDRKFKGPNSWEQKIIDLNLNNVKFVGDHSFWVTGKNGEDKNPDFIVTPFSKTHKIIEMWGWYYHNLIGEKWEDKKALYDELKYKSLFLFDEDIHSNSYIKKVENFAKS